MAKEDAERYIEMEVPGLEVIDNYPASLLCYGRECRETVEVDPETLVLEDDEAVYVEPKDSSGEKHMTQVFCSAACRDEFYHVG